MTILNKETGELIHPIHNTPEDIMKGKTIGALKQLLNCLFDELNYYKGIEFARRKYKEMELDHMRLDNELKEEESNTE